MNYLKNYMKHFLMDLGTVGVAATPGYLLWLNHYGTPIVAFITAICGLAFMVFKLMNEYRKYKKNK